jgi:hypothetical protein
MWLTFVKDDDGKIWLFDVRHLVVKKHPTTDTEKKIKIADQVD